eukprot:TRINITY_DN4391_c1_g1_i2.p1 TRINITY_DN4391_c1_g1~~TRINITY_DN4391_c1_g1_i2.p1  ORF type:complete len:178 (+),score=9.15 TRINITY_DN4391_c1_g1_i2:518-1051(+)
MRSLSSHWKNERMLHIKGEQSAAAMAAVLTAENEEEMHKEVPRQLEAPNLPAVELVPIGPQPRPITDREEMDLHEEAVYLYHQLEENVYTNEDGLNRILMSDSWKEIKNLIERARNKFLVAEYMQKFFAPFLIPYVDPYQVALDKVRADLRSRTTLAPTGEEEFANFYTVPHNENKV